jgi:hypothetical protein
MSRKVNDESAVGYKNPPEHSQFKPGQSGNPRGRPKGSRNTATMLNEILREMVTVNQGGRRVRMSRLEVMIRTSVRKAVQGDSRAYRNVTQWADYCGLTGADDPPVEHSRGGVVRVSELEDYLAQLDAE